MKQKQSQENSDKVNEIMKTLRLLGIGAKSFNINFNDLPVHLRGKTKAKDSRKTSVLIYTQTYPQFLKKGKRSPPEACHKEGLKR